MQPISFAMAQTRLDEPVKKPKSKGRAPKRGQQKSSSLSSALSKVTLTSDLSWEEARARAGDLFPGHRIVDTFGQLRSDVMGVVRKEEVVAVVKMEGVYPSFGRHGRCLKDADGRSSFVLFHTGDNPRPHFRYDQLREGHFLCFQHAFMHHFMDGSVGFRINHAKEVRILEPTKQTKKKESASAPVTSLATGEQWSEARTKAKALFPDQRVVDSLPDLDQGAMIVEGLQKGRFVCVSCPFVTIDMDCYAINVKDARKVGMITL